MFAVVRVVVEFIELNDSSACYVVSQYVEDILSRLVNVTVDMQKCNAFVAEYLTLEPRKFLVKPTFEDVHVP